MSKSAAESENDGDGDTVETVDIRNPGTDKNSLSHKIFHWELHSIIQSVLSTSQSGNSSGVDNFQDINNSRERLLTTTTKNSLTRKTEDVPTNSSEGQMNTEIRINKTCDKVWIKFSKNNSSPSHINNNVQLYENGDGDKRLKNMAKIPKCNNNSNSSNGSSKSNNEEIEVPEEHKIRRNKNRKILNFILVFLLMMFRFIRIVLKCIGIGILVIVATYCLIALHKPSLAFISRNTQDLIYPFMRALRLLSLPVVKQLPILTDYYEESCLFANPFYETDDLGCWPCESVRHVIDLTGFSNFSQAYHHSGVPFIVKDAFINEIRISDINRIYSENRHVIGKVFVETNQAILTTLEDVFSPENEENLRADDFYFKWNINRVISARVWRKYFPKPYFIPETEISVQHFLFVDRVSAQPYRLPMTEFANVFLTQASGSRSIVLIPTKNCIHHCKVVSVILQPKDVLFYNWLFWNPMSVPASEIPVAATSSVTFLGSFY